MQVPDDEDEAGCHAGGVHEVRRTINGTVVGVVRRSIDPEARVLSSGGHGYLPDRFLDADAASRYLRSSGICNDWIT